MRLPLLRGKGWSRRVLKPELLETARFALAEKNLHDMARINRWFGPHRALLRVIKDLVSPQEQFSLLDVGAGSGDMGNCILKRFRHAKVVSLDLRINHLHNVQSPRVAADAFQLPFLPKAFDFVLCSSFLHHFPDSQVINLIAELRRVTRRAVIVLDLERHPVAHSFLPMTKRLFGWSPLTIHDGPVSVAAAFHPVELAALVRAAGADSTIVQRHRPWFRISAVVWARSAEIAEQNLARVESASHARMVSSAAD
jgi:SAM-dependent methyltransferase